MHTVVIAGVGPGLGASLAWTFAAEGCAVALFARSPDYIGDLEAELQESGYDALAVPTDVSDPDAVEEAFEQVRTTLGPVDTLVFNASAAPWKGLTSITDAEFDHALGVNVRGALSCAREAVADMLDGSGGTVIFTGATTATRGRKGALGFSAAKFAARGMAESMAREVGPEGIHVAHVVSEAAKPPRAVRAA